MYRRQPKGMSAFDEINDPQMMANYIGEEPSFDEDDIDDQFFNPAAQQQMGNKYGQYGGMSGYSPQPQLAGPDAYAAGGYAKAQTYGGGYAG